MDTKKWKQEYPQMPQSFHMAVQEAVEQNLGKTEKAEKIRTGSRRLPKKRWFIAVAAMMLIWGSLAATADEKFDFYEYLGMKPEEWTADIFQEEIQVEVAEEPLLPSQDADFLQMVKEWEPLENQEALLDIREVMFDGMRLAIYAVPTEEGKKYNLEVVNLYINGEKTEPALFGDHAGKEDAYTVEVDLSRMAPDGAFEVRMPVRVYGRDSSFWKDGQRFMNQDLVFTVQTEGKVEELAPQSVVYEDFTLHVTELKRSVTAVKGIVEAEMNEKQLAAYEQNGRSILRAEISGADGKIWKGYSLAEEEALESHNNQGNFRWYFYSGIPAEEETYFFIQLIDYGNRQDEKEKEIYAAEEGKDCLDEPVKILMRAQ